VTAEFNRATATPGLIGQHLDMTYSRLGERRNLRLISWHAPKPHRQHLALGRIVPARCRLDGRKIVDAGHQVSGRGVVVMPSLEPDAEPEETAATETAGASDQRLG
jgi:hypothetical protein